jgi:hypothetical protein
MKNTLIISLTFFFHTYYFDPAMGMNFNPQPNESTIMSKNKLISKQAVLLQLLIGDKIASLRRDALTSLRGDTISSLRRKTEWSQMETNVVNGEGKSFPATLYTAEYELTDFRKYNKDAKIGILRLALEGQAEVTWLAEMPMPGDSKYPDRYKYSGVFVEVNGEIYGCFSEGMPRLFFLSNSIPRNKQTGKNVFSCDRLDELVVETLPINRYYTELELYLQSFFERAFFDRARFPIRPAQTIWGRTIFNAVSAENDIFCFEVENTSLRRRGKIWVDIKKRTVLKSEEITHLIDPKEKVELKTSKLFPWKAECYPVKSSLSSRNSATLTHVLTGDGLSFPVSHYWTAMAFNKTVTGELIREAVRFFHVNRKGKENIWVDVYRVLPTYTPQHFIEFDDELITCCFSGVALYFVNTSVKIEKTNKDFAFGQEALDELFSNTYSKFPNLPYKFQTNTVELSDFFDEDFFKMIPRTDGKVAEWPAIEKITAKDGLFCFEIRNFSTDRRGKVWIDPSGYKVVKAEEIKAEDMPVSPSEPQAEKQ